MLLWGVAQSKSLRALLTTNNDPTSSSSTSSSTDRSDLSKLYSGIKFTRSTAQSSSTSGSSSSTSSSSATNKNDIPNYAAMPEYQVFFGSDEQPSTSSSSRFSPRIVGGSVAAPNRFFTMQLTKNATTGSWHFAGCSGTLISACHILTAAHCVAGNRKSLVQGLYVGAYTPFNGNSGYPYQFSAPQSITVHPSFNPTTDVNDVAIIRLDQCVDTNKFPPATVATPAMMTNVVNGQSVTTMGFGRLSMTSNVQTQTLLSVNLNYYGNSYCNSLYQPYGSTIYSDMFCAGVNGGGKDACQGDSGGPLILPNTSILLGVVSWGRGCAVANFPGVYNSVASHYTWIQNQVCADASVSASLPLCLTFSNRVQNSIPAPRGSPSQPAPVVRAPIRPTPRPTLRPTTKASFCNYNLNGAFSYTTSTGAVITIACSRMQVGQLGHKVCTQKGAMKTCPRSCHPLCQS